MIRQSFCWPCFRSDGESLAELFAFAARTGYAATESWAWGEELDENVAIAKEAGLAYASITGHDSIEKGLNDPAEHDRIEAELIRSIDKAAALAIPGVIAFGGGRIGTQTDVEALRHAVRGLRRVVPHAEAKGVTVNVEILNSRVDHPGYVADTVAWGLALAEAIASPRVKILFDLYHVQIMEGDVIRRFREAAPFVGHVHTAGNPGRKDLDEGEMHYPAIAQAIAETGYEGYVGHEFFTRGDRREALAKAFRLCAVDR